MSAVLLDTCAVISLAQGEAGRVAIWAAAMGDAAYVPTATAREIKHFFSY